MSALFLPDTVLSILFRLTHLIPISKFDVYYYYSHFTDGESESQKG